MSLDALGSRATLRDSLSCLRKLGRHVQVGLLVGADAGPPLPMDRVIARELEILGSHGMQADQYGRIFDLMRSGALDPARLVRRRIALEEAPAVLRSMGEAPPTGVTVISRFRSGSAPPPAA